MFNSSNKSGKALCNGIQKYTQIEEQLSFYIQDGLYWVCLSSDMHKANWWLSNFLNKYGLSIWKHTSTCQHLSDAYQEKLLVFQKHLDLQKENCLIR